MINSRHLCALLSTTAADWGIGFGFKQRPGRERELRRHDGHCAETTGEKASAWQQRPAAPPPRQRG